MNYFQRRPGTQSTLRTSHATTFVLLALLPAGLAEAESSQSTSEIAVKEVRAVGIAYMETSGPYWRIGTLLTQVFQYRQENQLSGPVFVRYLQDPLRTAPAALQVQVGIVLADGHQPKAPLQLGQRASETVVSQVINSHSPEPRREAMQLADWAIANNYVPLGPLVEVYLDDLSNTATRVEVQMPVRKREPQPAQAPATPATQDDASRVDPPNAVTVVGAEAAAVAGANSAPYERTEATAVYQVQATPAREATSTAQTSRSVEGPARPSPAMEAPAPPRVTVAEANAHSAPPPQLRVVEWLREGTYAEITDRLVPDRPIDPATELWLLQWVSRLGAAARGADKTGLDPRRQLASLHEALLTRCETVLGAGKVGQRDTAILWARLNDPALTTKRAILHQLDVLLARLGARSIDTDGLQAALAGLLDQSIREVSLTPQAP